MSFHAFDKNIANFILKKYKTMDVHRHSPSPFQNFDRMIIRPVYIEKKREILTMFYECTAYARHS